MFSLINASARNLFDILFHVCCVSKKNLMSAYDITDPKQPYDCCVPSKPLPEYCVPQVCVWVGVTLGNRRQELELEVKSHLAVKRKVSKNCLQLTGSRLNGANITFLHPCQQWSISLRKYQCHGYLI